MALTLKRPFLATLTLFAAATALFAAAADGQDEETRRHGIFIDSIDVSLVNVDVVVTHDGEPVTDLTREDFEVFDDGEPVGVSHFYAVWGGFRQATDAASEDEATRLSANLPREDTSLVVLIDNPFISPVSRKRVFEALERQLDALMDGGTRVMMVTKDRQIRVVQPFTTDRDAVRAALVKTAESGGSLDRYFANSASIVRQIESAARAGGITPQPPAASNGPGAIPRGVSPDTTLTDARQTANALQAITAEQYHEVRSSLSVLATFVNSLAGMPGRKAVLYVCDRLPLRPGEREWQIWYRKYGLAVGRQLGITSVDNQVRDYDTSNDLNQLLDDATASGIAFYPVGAGLASRSAFSADRAGASTVGAPFSESAAAGGGLRLLASATGGKAAIGVLTPDAFLEDLQQDLSHYYSLGYPSLHRGDGQSHRIKVKVKRPGVEVRYLERYADKGTDEEMHDRTLMAVLLGTAENPLGVELEVTETKPQKDGLVAVALEVRFPLSKLVLVPQQKRHVGDVSIFLLVRDESGRLSAPVKIPVPIEIPNEEILGALTRNALYRTTVAMRPGKQTIAVAVRDEISAESSTVCLDLNVNKGRG